MGNDQETLIAKTKAETSRQAKQDAVQVQRQTNPQNAEGIKMNKLQRIEFSLTQIEQAKLIVRLMESLGFETLGEVKKAIKAEGGK